MKVFSYAVPFNRILVNRLDRLDRLACQWQRTDEGLAWTRTGRDNAFAWGSIASAADGGSHGDARRQHYATDVHGSSGRGTERHRGGDFAGWRVRESRP